MIELQLVASHLVVKLSALHQRAIIYFKDQIILTESVPDGDDWLDIEISPKGNPEIEHHFWTVNVWEETLGGWYATLYKRVSLDEDTDDVLTDQFAAVKLEEI